MPISCWPAVDAAIQYVQLPLAMCMRKEALFSAQIEGIKATLDDILDLYIEDNSNAGVAEILDNVHAISYAVNQLTQNGVSLGLRLLQNTHKVLLTHRRGANKAPGEFRTKQNWIGPAGCPLRRAVYVPPNPEDMQTALNELESYMHTKTELDVLIRAALIHYQFETIHPFLDGNGRIGRILIMLFMLEQHVISAPYLYISYYLKLNRSRYYAVLTAVRKYGNYEDWIKFFSQSNHLRSR